MRWCSVWCGIFLALVGTSLQTSVDTAAEALESRSSDLPYYDYELDAEESAGYESVVTAPTVDDYTERCPCKRRTDCSNPYGSSVYDIQNYGVIPPCSQHGMIPCCKRSILTFDQDDSTRPDLATLFGPVLPADQYLDNPNEIAVYYKESDLDGPVTFDDNQTVFIDQIPAKDLPMEHRDSLESLSVVNEAVKSDFNDTKGVSAYTIASSSDKNHFDGVKKDAAHGEKAFPKASSSDSEYFSGKQYSAVSEKESSPNKSSEDFTKSTVPTVLEKDIINTVSESSEDLTQRNYHHAVNESKTEKSSIIPGERPIVQQSFTRFYTTAPIPEKNRPQEQKTGLIHFPSNQVRFYDPAKAETAQMNVHSQAISEPQLQSMIMHPVRQHQSFTDQAYPVPPLMAATPYAPSVSHLSQKLPHALSVKSKIIQAADINKKIIDVAGVHSSFAEVAEIQDKIIEDVQQKKLQYAFSQQQQKNIQHSFNLPPSSIVPNAYKIDQPFQQQVIQLGDSKQPLQASLSVEPSIIFTPIHNEDIYRVIQTSPEQNLRPNFGSPIHDNKFSPKTPSVTVPLSFITPNVQSSEYKFTQSSLKENPMASFVTQNVKDTNEFTKKTPSAAIPFSDTAIPLGLIFQPAAHRYLTGSTYSGIKHLSPSSVYSPSSMYTSEHEAKAHEQKLKIPSNIYQTNWNKAMPHNTPITKFGTDSESTFNGHVSSFDSTAYGESPHSNVSPILRPGVHSFLPSTSLSQYNVATDAKIYSGYASNPMMSNEFQSTAIKNLDRQLNTPMHSSSFEKVTPENASDVTPSFHYSSSDQLSLDPAHDSVKPISFSKPNAEADEQNSGKSAEVPAINGILSGVKHSAQYNSAFKETSKLALNELHDDSTHSVNDVPSHVALSHDNVNLQDTKLFKLKDIPAYEKPAQSFSSFETSQKVHDVIPLPVSSQMTKDYGPLPQGSVNLQNDRPDAPYKSDIVHQSTEAYPKNVETNYPSIIAHSAVALQQPTFNSSSKHSVTMYYTGSRDFDVNLKRLEELMNETAPYESLNKEIKNEKAFQSLLGPDPKMNEKMPIIHKKYEQSTAKSSYVKTPATTQSVVFETDTTLQTSPMQTTVKSPIALSQTTAPTHLQPKKEATTNINAFTEELKAPYLNRKEKVRAKLYGKQQRKSYTQRPIELQNKAVLQHQNLQALNSQGIANGKGSVNNHQYHEQIRAPVSVYMPSNLPVRPRVQSMTSNMSPTANRQQQNPNKAPNNLVRPSPPQPMNVPQAVLQGQNSLNPLLTSRPMNAQPFRSLTTYHGNSLPGQSNHPKQSYSSPNTLPPIVAQRPPYPNGQQLNYGAAVKYPTNQQPQLMNSGFVTRPRYPTALPVMPQHPGKSKGKENQKETLNEPFSMGKELIHAGKDLLGSGKDKLHHSFESTKDKIHSSLESGKDKFHQTVESGKEMFDDTKHIGKEVLKFLVPTIKPSFLFGKEEKKPQKAPENLVFLQTSPAYYQPNTFFMRPNVPVMRPNTPAMRPSNPAMRPSAPIMRPQGGNAPYQGY